MEAGGDSRTELDRRASPSPDSLHSESSVLDKSILTPEQAAQTGVDAGMQNGSSAQSPPLQTMDRSEGYDPNRIPASVFSSKPATPTEWSVASSESLFSIHVGHPSFTTEFAQFAKSGELNKSQEGVSASALLPVSEATDMERGSEVREASAGQTKGASVPSEEDNGNQKTPRAEGFRDSSSSLHSSDSTLSFAFPVLEVDGGRSSSVNVPTEEKQQQEEQEKPRAESQPQPRPQPETETQKEPQPVSNAPEATQNAAGTQCFSFFSCFPCLSSCSCF